MFIWFLFVVVLVVVVVFVCFFFGCGGNTILRGEMK